MIAILEGKSCTDDGREHVMFIVVVCVAGGLLVGSIARKCMLNG